MAAHIGDILEAVRERRFYQKRAQIRVFSGEGPDLFRRSGIADMKQGLILRLNKKRNRGYYVADPDRGNGVATDRGNFALPQGKKFHHGNPLGWPGNLRKVWPHLIVEKGLGQSVDYAGHTPDVDGNFTFAIEIISQSAERHHVIQMNVSH